MQGVGYQMNLEADNIKNLLYKWQDILRLRDWDIKYEPVAIPWRKTADIKIDMDDKKAILLINNCNPRQTNCEHLVVHELLHLKLWGMDRMVDQLLGCVYGQDDADPKREFAYTQFMTTLESSVEDLAKGYMALGGDDKELSFGRVQKQVEEEMEKAGGGQVCLEQDADCLPH
jgi:hypothetical protein